MNEQVQQEEGKDQKFWILTDDINQVTQNDARSAKILVAVQMHFLQQFRQLGMITLTDKKLNLPVLDLLSIKPFAHGLEVEGKIRSGCEAFILDIEIEFLEGMPLKLHLAT